MTFEEWWKAIAGHISISDHEMVAKYGWEAGIREGIDRMYTLYNICPECKMTSGQHKMDCGRGR